jgi:hypothetical protein
MPTTLRLVSKASKSFMIIAVAPPSLYYKPKINRIYMVLIDVIYKWRHMAQVSAKNLHYKTSLIP